MTDRMEMQETTEDCSLICERRRAFFAVILAVFILGTIYGSVKIARDIVVSAEK